jgi:hypothetical protein
LSRSSLTGRHQDRPNRTHDLSSSDSYSPAGRFGVDSPTPNNAFHLILAAWRGFEQVNAALPVERIEADNLAFRSNPDFCELYMPFDHLLFFGDEGSGDQFAFRILAGGVQSDNVFQWVHENDSRQWFAGDIRDYLARALGHESYFSTLR